MRLKEIRTNYIVELSSIYDEDEAHSIFLLVIEQYLSVSRSNYTLRKEEQVVSEKLKLINSTLDELKTGKPIQYILGETVFYGLPFEVNETVLIPRPETEELVDWVIEKVLGLQSPVDSLQPATRNLQFATILDIGTGSGCIAISLKKNLSQLHVTALDVSSEALTIAKQNAVLNEVEITFIEDDIITSHISPLTSQYSIIVSNPPYITQNEKEQMHQNVLANEPHLALFVSNERPLVFYEAIADFALENLIENGFLFFEINEYLGKETVDMLSHKGFKNIELRKDMQGKDRMICCVLNR